MSKRLAVVWLLLLGLIGAILVFDRAMLINEKFDHAPDEHIHPEPHRLLPMAIDQIGAIEIVYRGLIHRFERDEAGRWLYHHHDHKHRPPGETHQHHADLEQAQRIADAFAALGRARIERSFAADGAIEAYGLAKPEMFIIVYKTDQPLPLARYIVGHVAPDTVSRYVMIDGGSEILTIANYQIDNVVDLLDSFSAAA